MFLGMPSTDHISDRLSSGCTRSTFFRGFFFERQILSYLIKSKPLVPVAPHYRGPFPRQFLPISIYTPPRSMVPMATRRHSQYSNNQSEHHVPSFFELKKIFFQIFKNSKKLKSEMPEYRIWRQARIFSSYHQLTHVMRECSDPVISKLRPFLEVKIFLLCQKVHDFWIKIKIKIFFNFHFFQIFEL